VKSLRLGELCRFLYQRDRGCDIRKQRGFAPHMGCLIRKNIYNYCQAVWSRIYGGARPCHHSFRAMVHIRLMVAAESSDLRQSRTYAKYIGKGGCTATMLTIYVVSRLVEL
jgi:hypothetical protein